MLSPKRRLCKFHDIPRTDFAVLYPKAEVLEVLAWKHLADTILCLAFSLYQEQGHATPFTFSACWFEQAY